MAVQQAIGRKLRELRHREDLTQKELAEKLQGRVDYSYIGKIERGEQLPSLKMLTRLSEALAVPLSYFFQESDSEAASPTRGPRGRQETLERQQERLLRTVVRDVHVDDIPLLVEIVRILNKHRRAERTGRGRAQPRKRPADGREGIQAAETDRPYQE